MDGQITDVFSDYIKFEDKYSRMNLQGSIDRKIEPKSRTFNKSGLSPSPFHESEDSDDSEAYDKMPNSARRKKVLVIKKDFIHQDGILESEKKYLERKKQWLARKSMARMSMI